MWTTVFQSCRIRGTRIVPNGVLQCQSDAHVEVIAPIGFKGRLATLSVPTNSTISRIRFATLPATL